MIAILTVIALINSHNIDNTIAECYNDRIENMKDNSEKGSRQPKENAATTKTLKGMA